MKIKAIHHIAIICSNYERSKRFYIDILGADMICETWREQRGSYKLDFTPGQLSDRVIFIPKAATSSHSA